MRSWLAVALAVLIVACGSSSDGGATCASGVFADGKCLIASGAGGSSSSGGAGGAGTPTGNAVGALCDQAHALVCGHAGDGTDDRILVCDGGAYQDFLPCAAPSTCANLAGNTSVHCGPLDDVVPYALEGDPCTPDAAAACPSDRKGLLVCKAATWTKASECTGSLLCHRSAAGTQGPGWSCPDTSTSGCVVCD